MDEPWRSMKKRQMPGVIEASGLGWGWELSDADDPAKIRAQEQETKNIVVGLVGSDNMGIE
jgi:hypothetical protein